MAGRLSRRTVTAVTALTALLGAYAITQPSPVRPAPAMQPAAETDPVRGTEAEAVAYAAKIGARVEIGAFRTETQSVFANDDGTLSSVDYAQPVRVVRDGAWVAADATLAEQPDGTIAPKAAAFGLRLSGGGEGPLLTAERAGRSMSLDWSGPLPEPVLAGDHVTYADVLPDVDLVVTVGVTDFSHVLVIKTAEAAQNPELATLEYGLRTDGLDVRPTGAGGLEAVDPAAGGAVFEAGTPIMWDSGTKATAKALAVREAPESATQVPLGVTVTGDTLTLTPDRAMLTDPRTTFPVYVDPVWTDTRASSWAMVASGYPGTSYYKFKDDEGLGLCPVSSGTCAGVGTKRIYYTLPTPFSGKTILSAELAVTMTHTYDSTARDVSLYRASSGVSSGTTWNNQPGLSTLQDTKSPTATKSSCESANQNVTFDVKQAVGDAAAKKASSATFALRSASESSSSSWKRFCNNAILSVHYNRAPNTPAQGSMKSNPGGNCVYGSTRPYTDTAPVLEAVLSDPDKTASNTEQLTAEFKIYWTPSGGSTVTQTYKTGKKASGSKFTLDTGATLSPALKMPNNTVIAWEVRASDGTTSGNWSSYGDQTRCEFVIDPDVPVAPDIDSPEYLPLDSAETTGRCAVDETPATDPEDGPSSAWRGWVGLYSTFTFDTASTDAIEYWYGFDTNPSAANVLTPAALGGPVSVTWMPTTAGPHTINVLARDRTKGAGAVGSCTFYVPTRLSTGDWNLADDGPQATDERQANPATAGSGVTFAVPGPGCSSGGSACTTDRAVRLDGTTTGYLATAGSAPVVDTGKPFSVTAWVRLTDDTKTHVAVSQDGAGVPGFVLGFDSRTKKWTFSTPVSPVSSLGSWSSTSTATALKDVWTHLTGVYDPVQRTIQLYVNGVAQPAAPKRTPWSSFGALQFGRSRTWTGYGDFWTGDLADVNVFDRIVVPAEVKALALLRAQRKAYWPLDEQVGTVTEAFDDASGPDLTLAGGAQVVAPDQDTTPPNEWPMVGAGNLVLDGTDDYAATATPVAATGTSFTVSVRARLSAATCTRNMTVIAQAGTKESGFQIRCSAAGVWEAVLPQLDGTDATKAPVILTGYGLPSADPAGQQLVLVYDAFLRQASFYVDGQLSDESAGAFSTPWTSSGPLTVGRALRSSAYGDYFAGVVDEVRVYGGVLDPADVQRLGFLTPDENL